MKRKMPLYYHGCSFKLNVIIYLSPTENWSAMPGSNEIKISAGSVAPKELINVP